MTQDDLQDFLSCIRYSDAWLEYRKQRYFVHGCVCAFDALGGVEKCELSVSEADINGVLSKEVFRVVEKSPERCIAKLVKELRFGNQPFVELHRSVRWTLGGHPAGA